MDISAAPKISRHQRRRLYSYDTSCRVHQSAVYPVRARDGADVLLFGHDRGLKVLWTENRRHTKQQRANGRATNGTRDEDLDAIDEGTSLANGDGLGHSRDQDSDTQQAELIQDIDIPLEAPILHIAVPSISEASVATLPPSVQNRILVITACSNSELILWSIPLEPPTEADKANEDLGIAQLILPGDESICTSLTCKIVTKQESDHPEQEDTLLLIAGASASAWLLEVDLEDGRLSDVLRQRVLSVESGLRLVFPHAAGTNLLCLYNHSGWVKVCDVGKLEDIEQENENGKLALNQCRSLHWLLSYHTPYRAPKDGINMAGRKRILSCAWVWGGRALMALLEDGQWGVWGVQGFSQTNRPLYEFVLQGHLAPNSAEPTESSQDKRKGTKLAPMTPNTRKVKSQKIFSASPATTSAVPGAATSGGISVTPISSRSGSSDECALLWYNNDIYSIPSVQNFWQRSTTKNSNSLWTLHVPGISRVTDINLKNENVTSISHLATTTSINSTGQFNAQKDFLVSAEHRFMLLLNDEPTGARRTLFEQTRAADVAQDQRMLDVGELDIGGLDRMLDNLASGSHLKARKVGFAS